MNITKKQLASIIAISAILSIGLTSSANAANLTQFFHLGDSYEPTAQRFGDLFNKFQNTVKVPIDEIKEVNIKTKAELQQAETGIFTIYQKTSNLRDAIENSDKLSDAQKQQLNMMLDEVQNELMDAEQARKNMEDTLDVVIQQQSVMPGDNLEMNNSIIDAKKKLEEMEQIVIDVTSLG